MILLLVYSFLILTVLLHVFFLVKRILHQKAKPKASFFKGKTIVVSGGSSGIGLSLAQEIMNICSKFQVGAKDETSSLNSTFPKSLVLIARDLKKLTEAQKILEAQIDELNKKNSKNSKKIETRIEIISCDVTNKDKVEEMFSGDEKIAKTLKSAEIWFLNQGIAIPKYFLQQDVSDFEKQMNVNFMANVILSKKILPNFVNRIKQGDKSSFHLIYTASSMSFTSFVGYSSYCASKMALKGFVNCLQNEFSGFDNIHFHLSVPADTETPGFEKENLSKPLETKILSSAGSLETSSQTASNILHHLINSSHFYLVDSIFKFNINDFLISTSSGTDVPMTNCPVMFWLKWFCFGIAAPFVRLFYWIVVKKHQTARMKRFYDAIEEKN